MTAMAHPKRSRRLAPIDYLAIVGGTLHTLVILAMVVYWLLH